ncbi:hypothetical protein [Alienimonas chondri]|nr:hypothetical protein [Alienimonas chondri]
MRPLLPAALCAFGVLSLSALDSNGVSQDGESVATAADSQPAGFEPTTEGVREGIDVYPRRLPPGLGVVRMSDAQKERVYAVQAKYHAQIEALRDQIAALEAKQEAEVMGVLSPAQQNFLKAWEAMKEAERQADEEAEANDAAAEAPPADAE